MCVPFSRPFVLSFAYTFGFVAFLFAGRHVITIPSSEPFINTSIWSYLVVWADTGAEPAQGQKVIFINITDSSSWVVRPFYFVKEIFCTLTSSIWSPTHMQFDEQLSLSKYSHRGSFCQCVKLVFIWFLLFFPFFISFFPFVVCIGLS